MSYNTECELIDYASHIEEGSTSSDSCKLEDIVNGVSDLIPKDLLDAFDAAPGWDEQGFAFDEIFDHLNEIAPDGLMFCASEGDGACYGFWKMEDDI